MCKHISQHNGLPDWITESCLEYKCNNTSVLSSMNWNKVYLGLRFENTIVDSYYESSWKLLLSHKSFFLKFISEY